MSYYMSLIGKNARKASQVKINTKIKNKILKKYVLLLKKEKNSILKAKYKRSKICCKKKIKKKFN